MCVCVSLTHNNWPEQPAGLRREVPPSSSSSPPPSHTNIGRDDRGGRRPAATSAPASQGRIRIQPPPRVSGTAPRAARTLPPGKGRGGLPLPSPRRRAELRAGRHGCPGSLLPLPPPPAPGGGDRPVLLPPSPSPPGGERRGGRGRLWPRGWGRVRSFTTSVGGVYPGIHGVPFADPRPLFSTAAAGAPRPVPPAPAPSGGTAAAPLETLRRSLFKQQGPGREGGDGASQRDPGSCSRRPAGRGDCGGAAVRGTRGMGPAVAGGREKG